MYDDGPEALCIDIPVLIKARTDGDRRLVGDCLEIGGAGVEAVVSRLISDRR